MLCLPDAVIVCVCFSLNAVPRWDGLSHLAGFFFFFLPLFLSWIKFHPGVLRLFYAPEGGGICACEEGLCKGVSCE